MLRAPNRHAAVFDPVQQSRQWEQRILAEERTYLPVAEKEADAAATTGGLGATGGAPKAEPSAVPVLSSYKPAHYFNHRGLDPPESVVSSARSRGMRRCNALACTSAAEPLSTRDGASN